MEIALGDWSKEARPAETCVHFCSHGAQTREWAGRSRVGLMGRRWACNSDETITEGREDDWRSVEQATQVDPDMMKSDRKKRGQVSVYDGMERESRSEKGKREMESGAIDCSMARMG